MSDFRYATFKTYLNTQWTRVSPQSCGLPWFSLLLLHLTISVYESLLFAGIQKPYRKSDLIQTPVLMSLYHCSKIMEKRIFRIVGWMAEGAFYTGTLFIMVLLSFVINVTIIFAAYLILIAVGMGLRDTIRNWIKHQIAVRSYTTLLYSIHLR